MGNNHSGYRDNHSAAGPSMTRKDQKLQQRYAWSGNSNASSGTSRYDRDGNLITTSDRAETRDTLMGWFWTALLAVLIPIIILFVAQLVMANQSDGYRWKLWQNEGSRITQWVIYGWLLALFALIVWYGKRMAITNRASQNMRTLIGALFVFWNLAAIIGILTLVLSAKHNSQKGHWWAQWPVFVALTCLCMFIWSIVWFSLIWRRLNRRQRRAGAFDYKADEDILPESADTNYTNTNAMTYQA